MEFKPFSWNNTHLINRLLPEENVSFAGYAALIEKYALAIPLPDVLAVISSKHTKYETDNWRVFTPAQTEFLYSCVEETISKTLPAEVDYLQKYDWMKSFVSQYIDMADHTADLLIRFFNQNDGKLSRRAQSREFSALTGEEIRVLESKYEEIFETRWNTETSIPQILDDLQQVVRACMTKTCLKLSILV